MLKHTLHFGNPTYLSTGLNQFKILLKDSKIAHSIPIEDIGIVILDHPQITITHAVIGKLLENNVALITCNQTHHPTGLMLNLDGHTKQSKLFQHQINASEPLKKQLWKQTIQSKIKNQHLLLKSIGVSTNYLQELLQTLKSGDTTNITKRRQLNTTGNIILTP